MAAASSAGIYALVLTGALLFQAPGNSVSEIAETRAQTTTDHLLLQSERQELRRQDATLRSFCSQRLAEPAYSSRRKYCTQKLQDLAKRDAELIAEMDRLARRVRELDAKLAGKSHK